MRIAMVGRRSICVLAMLCAVPALAAVDAYMTFDGGPLASAGSVHATGVTHPMAAMGMSTGRRMHGEIVITKEVDQASPKFRSMQAAQEPLGTMTITFQGSGAGAGKVAQKIVLTNAMITGLQVKGNTETITIDYDSSDVTYRDGGKSATDDWEVPEVALQGDCARPRNVVEPLAKSHGGSMRRAGLAGRLTVVWLAAMLAAAQAVASAPAVMMLDATGAGTATGSNVKGNKPKKGSEPAGPEIELLSVSRSSGDAATGMSATGMAAGKRSSTTLVVTKAYGADSAVLEQAAAVNQIFREVTIRFETSSAASSASGSSMKGSSKGSNKASAASSGMPESKTAQELVLRNAQITEIVQERNIQRITLEYQSIEATNPTGKSLATDDWETP